MISGVTFASTSGHNCGFEGVAVTKLLISGVEVNTSTSLGSKVGVGVSIATIEGMDDGNGVLVWVGVMVGSIGEGNFGMDGRGEQEAQIKISEHNREAYIFFGEAFMSAIPPNLIYIVYPQYYY